MHRLRLLSALVWTRRFVSGVNEDRRLAAEYCAYVRNRRSAASDAIGRGSAVGLHAARVTLQRGAQRDGYRRQELRAAWRRRREWEWEVQEAALSIIPAEQSRCLFPSAITSPSIYSPPRSTRATSIVPPYLSAQPHSLLLAPSEVSAILS